MERSGSPYLMSQKVTAFIDSPYYLMADEAGNIIIHFPSLLPNFSISSNHIKSVEDVIWHHDLKDELVRSNEDCDDWPDIWEPVLNGSNSVKMR